MKPGGTGPVAFATPPGYPAAAVGDGLGVGLGDGVGLGLAVGVGVAVGAVVGCAVGAAVGAAVGTSLLAVVGAAVGDALALADGLGAALTVGAGVDVKVAAFTVGVDIGGVCVAAAALGASVPMKPSFEFAAPLQPANSRTAMQAMAAGALTITSV